MDSSDEFRFAGYEEEYMRRTLPPAFPYDEWGSSVEEFDTNQLITFAEQCQIEAFHPIRTPFSIVLLVVIVICLELAVFLVPFYCTSNTVCGIQPYSMLMYVNASLWFLFIIIDRCWRYEHYKSRARGYLNFYRQTCLLRRIPILVHSGSTAVLLVVSTLVSDYCEGDTCSPLPLTRYNYVQLITSVEVVIILPVLIVYLVHTVRFNLRAAKPDIQEEDLMGALSVASRSLGQGIGFRDDTNLDDIIEKQADMIRHFKDHNAHLGRKVLQLTTQLERLSTH